MAILRKLSAKLRTAISPASSPEPSPTAQTGSSFGVLSGRKEGGSISVTRPEHHMRSDSLMTYATNSSKETVEEGEKKPRRMSRFREELDADVWDQ